MLLQHVPPLENEPRGIWLGAEDVEEGLWKWSVGPETGTQFWQGKGTQGNSLDGQYNHWREHEPNNADDSTEEDCASVVISSQGDTLWNDLPCRDRLFLVAEYGDDTLSLEGVSAGGISHDDL